ncbi:hypothetical protein AAFF_G00283150 [Aldrovandia affinis]|uniref:Troponin I, fast skeletal muscle n=1 Tax=Aldrovandia affinis TaxID=143900 RepID=A0AAD7X1V2_9TELE|nr:hypothetical protein AAFF_G00283150 [Aldrovandia affinis]
MSEKKMSSSRKHNLKSLMLSIAKGLLEVEAREKEQEREDYMNENCPPLSLPGTVHELQELCKKLHQRIDTIDEERYDLEMKENKCAKEIEDMKFKVIDLKGKFKKPALRKVRMSADAMLKALLGSKHTVNMDLRANLKQVKKEVKEEDKEMRDVGDWRKNIEDKSGMDGRKKMFETENPYGLPPHIALTPDSPHWKPELFASALGWEEFKHDPEPVTGHSLSAPSECLLSPGSPVPWVCPAALLFYSA